ncbi:MAG: glycerol kinase GlpK [Phycisphaeraceae bacterium]
MPDPQYILALDQGTTSSRAILFDVFATPVAVAQQDFEQLYPKPGWVEHDPMTLWQTQRDTAVDVLKQANATADRVAGVGITNQRETAVAWNRATGEPVCNAIVWQDRRTSDHVGRLKADGYDELIRRKTGLVPDAYFSATKFAWVLERVEEATRLAAQDNLCLGTVDTWLIYNLTNGERFITDATNASRTMLYDIEAGRWDDELLELFGVPRNTLPEVVDSFGPFADVSAIDELKGLPIAGIAGDQQAALFGQMCIHPGMVKNTYGTGCFMLMNTGDQLVRSKAESGGSLLTTIALQQGGGPLYALEGGVFIAGAVVQWLRDGLGFIETSEAVEALANAVPDAGGVHLVPAFAGLGAPYWDQDARGLISGLTRGTTKAHLARAALESIAFQSADLLDAMRRDADELPFIGELRVDGGAARNDTLMQMQADLLQIPVTRPTVTETTALGAAYMAGLATGFWRDLDSLESNWLTERTFEPMVSAEVAEEALAGWRKAIERARL